MNKILSVNTIRQFVLRNATRVFAKNHGYKLIPISAYVILQNTRLDNRNYYMKFRNIYHVSTFEEDLNPFWDEVEEKIDSNNLKELADFLKKKIDENTDSELFTLYIIDILTSVLIEMNEINEAEEYILKAFKMLETISSEEHNRFFIENIFKLKEAKILSLKEEVDKAEEKFEDVKKRHLELLESNRTKSNNVFYIQILFWHCLHLVHVNNMRKAKDILTEASNFFHRNMQNLQLKEEMIINYTLSNLYTLIDDYNRALEFIENAIVIAKNLQSTQLAKYYLEIGQIYLLKDQFDLAVISFTEAQNIAEKLQEIDVLNDAKYFLTFVSILINDNANC